MFTILKKGEVSQYWQVLAKYKKIMNAPWFAWVVDDMTLLDWRVNVETEDWQLTTPTFLCVSRVFHVNKSGAAQ